MTAECVIKGRQHHCKLKKKDEKISSSSNNIVAPLEFFATLGIGISILFASQHQSKLVVLTTDKKKNCTYSIDIVAGIRIGDLG